MLDRGQIVERATLAPAVTPMVRIPPNGTEMNQWIAKQVLDIGVFGIIFPHVSTVEEAGTRSAPAVIRGWPARRATIRRVFVAMRRPAPLATGASLSRNITNAPMSGRSRREAKFWLSFSAKRRAPSIICREFLKEVPGIGVVLIGEGDLSQELGPPARL